MIRFVDLFAGIGGIRLGFEQTMAEFGIDCECVLSSEIDKHAQETYRMNFGDSPQGDIHQITSYPPFDFLLGGFPCQPFSYAGKQKGFGDTRGTLFFEIERLLATYQPSGFLLENVRGLTTHDGGRTLSTIVAKLENLGYGVSCLLLNSSDFNVPQNRVRIYIVGIKGAQPRMTLQSSRGATDSHQYKRRRDAGDLFQTDNAIVVRDILEPSPHPTYDCSPAFQQRLQAVLREKKLPIDGVRMIDFRNGNSVHSWELGIKGECSADEVAFMNALIANRRKKTFGAHQDGKSLSLGQIKSFFDHPDLTKIIRSLLKKKYLRERDGLYNPVSGNMSFEVFKFLDLDSISITLVTSDAHKLGVMHHGRLRRITPRECARIQGYPDTFQHHPVDLHAYRQFGNSVSVPVIKAVLSDLFAHNVFWKQDEQDKKKTAHRVTSKGADQPIDVMAVSR
jgi:DNA (cytosine-5)-methyltransferase 1